MAHDLESQSYISSNEVSDYDYRAKIDEEVLACFQNRIWGIIYENGLVYSWQLEDLYLKKYDKPFPLEFSEFRSIDALIDQMPEIEKIREKEDLIYSVNFRREGLTDCVTYPATYMKLGETIERVSISDLQVGDQIEVTVTNIYSPSHIWMQRLDDQFYSAYRTMNDEMNQYYNSEPALPKITGAAGLYCCAIHLGRWERAVIVKFFRIDCHVKVLFIDHGQTRTLHPSSLRVLHSNWATVPALALKCRLANVVPRNTIKWSNGATLILKSFVKDEELFAEIVSKDPVAEEIWVYLQKENYGSVNCELILNDEAILEPNSMMLVEKVYESPTFSEIEEFATPRDMSLTLRRPIYEDVKPKLVLYEDYVLFKRLGNTNPLMALAFLRNKLCAI